MVCFCKRLTTHEKTIKLFLILQTNSPKAMNFYSQFLTDVEFEWRLEEFGNFMLKVHSRPDLIDVIAW